MSKSYLVLAATILSVISVSSTSGALVNDHRSYPVAFTLGDRSAQAIMGGFRIDETDDLDTTRIESTESHLVKAGLLSSIKKAAKTVGSGVKRAATAVGSGVKNAAKGVASSVKTVAVGAAAGAGKVVRAIQRVFKKKPTKIVGF